MTTSIFLEGITAEELTRKFRVLEEEISKITKSAEPKPEVEKPISQPDAIKFLGRTRQTFYTWRKKGYIKGHTLGGRVYYFKSELVKALKPM